MTALGGRARCGGPARGRAVRSAGARGGHQGLRGVAGALLRVVRAHRQQARAPRPGPARRGLPQRPQVLLEVGVEENVQEGVETGGQRAGHQEDELGDLGADEGEVQQGGEGQEGHGAVERAVGEEQQGHVAHHGAVPGGLGARPVRAAVELRVGDGHGEEAQRVEQHQGHRVAGGARLPRGQRQAERRGAVLAAAQQRHRGHGERERAAQRQGGPQPRRGRSRVRLPPALPRAAALQGRQSQQENGRLRGKNGQKAHDLAARPLLPPRAVPREAAEGERVHARQRRARRPGQQVRRRQEPDQQLDGGHAQRGSEHGAGHQGVAGDQIPGRRFLDYP